MDSLLGRYTTEAAKLHTSEQEVTTSFKLSLQDQKPWPRHPAQACREVCLWTWACCSHTVLQLICVQNLEHGPCQAWKGKEEHTGTALRARVAQKRLLPALQDASCVSYCSDVAAMCTAVTARPSRCRVGAARSPHALRQQRSCDARKRPRGPAGETPRTPQSCGCHRRLRLRTDAQDSCSEADFKLGGIWIVPSFTLRTVLKYSNRTDRTSTTTQNGVT
jgi:hypothetical protein